MNLDWSKYFNIDTLEKTIRFVIILIVGLIVIYTVAYMVRKLLPDKLSKQRKMIINRFVQYSGFIMLFLILIAELEIKLAAIFGAAGVIGLVVGVASQTSLGNIISGFFLISEKSFELGDVIKIGNNTGVVQSIDLLSIKIKTPDNLLLRIPNQTVISSELINVTKFPIRRFDFEISVAYKEDLKKVKSIIENVAKNNPLSLDEPEPLVTFINFADSGITVQVGIWFEKANLLQLRNSIFEEIKEAFCAEGIEIPFPHISIYSGEATKPFPVVTEEKIIPNT